MDIWSALILGGLASYWAYTVNKRLDAIQQEIGEIREDTQALLAVAKPLSD
jgi:hypothetical protein